jgi:RNA polymerase sigma-70 factor (sigma-E family)
VEPVRETSEVIASGAVPAGVAAVPGVGVALEPCPADQVAGDRDAVLARCYEADYQRLVGLARLLVDRRVEAEEVVQEAFVRVYANWHRIRDHADPSAYIRMTVVNLSRSGLRRRLTERRYRGRAAVALGPSATTTVRPDEAATDRERDRAVVAAVAGLPRRQREAVVLRYFENLSTAETAAALGCSEGAVKGYLNRAMTTLRTRVEEP